MLKANHKFPLIVYLQFYKILLCTVCIYLVPNLHTYILDLRMHFLVEY